MKNTLKLSLQVPVRESPIESRHVSKIVSVTFLLCVAGISNSLGLSISSAIGGTQLCMMNLKILQIFASVTRMHSSRMRTARSSSRLLGAGGVCLSVCWDTPPRPAPGPPLGRPPPGPGPGRGHTPIPGPWPGHPPGLGVDTPLLWTDTCENITFANFVCGR